MSIRNETRVWERLKKEAEIILHSYPTTLEEDLEMITQDAEGKGPSPVSENK